MSEGMADPVRENITGEKVQKRTMTHSVQHKVNWGHVAIGVAVLALAYVLAARWSGEEAEDDEDLESVDGASVPSDL